MVITALTTIAQQLISDCKHYGIDALSSNQASGRFNQWSYERSIFILSVSAQLLPGEFEEVMETQPPRLMICSALCAESEVRKAVERSSYAVPLKFRVFSSSFKKC